MSRTPEPTWEAVYEPGNVSNYLIGYLNDEKPAKAAAEAWLHSQAADIGNLAWDQWGQLGQFDENGFETDTGLVVRRRTETASAAPESELQRLRARIVADLKRAADGRIEYAEAIKDDRHPAKIELLVEAANFNTAAKVARGDKAALAALIPSWRWTDEEAAATPPAEQSGEPS